MRRAPLFWTIVAAATVAAFVHAWSLRWTCDDAFISFRYARNFVDGHGLVFNLDPQEAPVEGYSNFAWTMWLALGLVFGFVGDALESWAAFWGALLHAATVLWIGYCSWRSSRGTAVVPIAAPALAANYYAASLAPAGLETALFVFLVAVMAGLSIERRCPRHVWLLGFLGVLAAMTRPDGALPVMAAGLVVLVDAARSKTLRPVVAYSAPLLACMVPYLLWRHAYYGYWVPNTFYAKSGGDPYPGQGLVYCVEFAKTYAIVLVPALLAWLLLPLRRGDRFAAVDPWSGRRPGAVLLLFALPYLGFVIWVGGDFMFGRFLLPILPLWLLALDLTLGRRPWLAVVGAVVALGGSIWRHEPPGNDDYLNGRGFNDNRAISFRIYAGVPGVEYARGGGHALAEVFRGLPVRIGIAGGHANFAWRWNVPVAIECAAGLTDAYIAHLPVPARSMVGHERNWMLYPDYLIRRRVHFMLEQSFATGNESVDAARAITFFPNGKFPMPARIVVWDRELMAELRKREPTMRCVDLETALDRYIAEMPAKGKDKVRADYAALRSFYFDHNDDAPRRAAFEAFLK